jgi:hypothetical protein
MHHHHLHHHSLAVDSTTILLLILVILLAFWLVIMIKADIERNAKRKAIDTSTSTSEDEKVPDDRAYNTLLRLQAKSKSMGIKALSPPEMTFLAVYLLNMSVHNGGFDQYFYNTAGGYANVVVDGLKSIGANRTAEISAEAILLAFPGGEIPVNKTERQRLFVEATENDSSVAEKLEGLDLQFQNYPDDVYALLETYAMRNGFLAK